LIRIFRVLVPASVLLLFLADSLLIFACYAAVPYATSGGDLFLLDESLWQKIGIATGIILCGMYFSHLYDDLRTRSFGITFLAQTLIGYWGEQWVLQPDVLIPGSALTLIVVLLNRLLFRTAMRNEIGARRLLFIGWSPAAAQLSEHLGRHPELGLTPIGYLNGTDVGKNSDSTVACLGPTTALQELMEEYRPAWIVVGKREMIQTGRLDDFLELRFGGMHTELTAGLYETTLGRVCLTETGPAELIFSETWWPKPVSLIVQSVYSRVIALVALIVAAPIFLMLAILMKTSSAGPVLVRERRIGMNGVPFTMYRFAWPRKEIAATDRGEVRPRSRLEVLPQLWNVLRGDMSIVGPYPDRPEFAERLNAAISFHCQRNAVKPGITAWSQIQWSEQELTHDAVRRLECDLYYVKNLSPSLDFSVMLRWLRTSFG
jgi:lipopolysaccharide/colanic/teichoic acid biosynthesis glycosyltransferase